MALATGACGDSSALSDLVGWKGQLTGCRRHRAWYLLDARAGSLDALDEQGKRGGCQIGLEPAEGQDAFGEAVAIGRA